MSIKSPSSPQFPLKKSWNDNNQININNQQQENFSAIWRHYERHIRRLERYRKARSFCSISDESSSSTNSGNNLNNYKQQLNYFSSSSSSKINLESQQKLNEGKNKNCEDINITILNKSIDNNNIYINSNQNDQFNKDEQQFEDLKEKMMMLVENDIVLLAKLLSLGDTLNELRQYQQQQQKYNNNNIPPTSSFNNLSIKLEENNEDFVDESKDEFKPLNEENIKQKILFFNVKQRKQQKRYPIPPEFGEGITRVYVEEEEEEGNKIKNEEEGGEHPNIQYFSRKNSVLRIPIPPRSSNRAFASRTKQNLLPSTSTNQTSTKIISHQQQKFPSPQISPKEIIKDFIESTLATTEIDSGHSSASEHPSPAPPLINSKEEKQQNSSRFSTLSSSCLSSAPSSLSGCSSRNIFDINSNSNVKNKQKNTEIQRTMGNKDFIKDK